MKWLSCWVMDDNINCENMNCLWIDGIVNVDVNYDDNIEMRHFEGKWILVDYWIEMLLIWLLCLTWCWAKLSNWVVGSGNPRVMVEMENYDFKPLEKSKGEMIWLIFKSLEKWGDNDWLLVVHHKKSCELLGKCDLNVKKRLPIL